MSRAFAGAVLLGLLVDGIFLGAQCLSAAKNMAAHHFTRTLLIWLFMPVASVWLSTTGARKEMTARSARLLFVAIAICSVLMSWGLASVEGMACDARSQVGGRVLRDR